MRILIADDDAIFRAVISRTLAMWGYTPQVVEDGSAAQAILAGAERPRLALLDWEMPGLDGPELCRRNAAAAHPQPTYCILLTVHATSTHITEGLEAGAHDFIAKPMHHLMLRRRLAVWRRLVELETEHHAAPLPLDAK